MTHIQDATITSATIEIGDHGFLSSFLHLDYGGSGQGFGGYALDRYDTEKKERVGSTICGIWIRRVLETVGVDNWHKLEGQNIRVEQDRPFGKILRIGHITKDKWFDPVEEFKD